MENLKTHFDIEAEDYVQEPEQPVWAPRLSDDFYTPPTEKYSEDELTEQPDETIGEQFSRESKVAEVEEYEKMLCEKEEEVEASEEHVTLDFLLEEAKAVRGEIKAVVKDLDELRDDIVRYMPETD